MSEVEAIEVPGQVHYIDGSFVGSVSGDTFDVINPATEEVVTTSARGGAEDVALAVKAAKKHLMGVNGPTQSRLFDARSCLKQLI